MAFAAAVSRHPITAHAVGEVCGQILEAIGATPDAALVFVTRAHAGALEDVGHAIRAILGPSALIGCASEGVLATSEEIEHGAAVVLFAGHVGRCAAAHLQTHAAGPDSIVLTGWPDGIAMEASAAVLLADPFSFPTESVLESLAADHPDLPIVGGLADAAAGPGGNRLLIQDRVVTGGAALLLFGDGVEVEAVTSQGSRPVGQPFTVTRAEGTTLHELGGLSAIARIAELAKRDLAPEDVAAVNRGGLHLAQVIDSRKIDIATGDVIVRRLLGGNQTEGWIAVETPVEVGDTVQFHLRDALGADDDLRASLRGREAEAVLAFTANGRGRMFFGEPDHDATVLDDLLDGPPVAGFFAAGEIGPLGGRNLVHRASTTMLLLRGRG